MGQFESADLQAARRLLTLFEQHPTEPEGLRALAEALPELSDLAQFASDERERASNLLATYARKAEELANQLLEDFDSIPNDLVQRWHEVMRQFEETGRALPESFHKTRSALIKRLVQRLWQQLSPAEREAFLAEKLRSR